MKQNKALDILKTGANVFLTGEAGSGKTYTITQFIEYLRGENIPYAITASTGIAATHIGGTTIHSWSGINIKKELSDEDVDKILSNQFTYDKITRTKVLIIDEVSMLDGQFLNDLDLVLSKARNFMSDSAFGGIQIVMVGDFFQLPPVSKDRSATFAFESESWKKANLKVCYLTEQHRQNDPVFLEVLTAIRQRRVTEKHKEIIKKNKPSKIPTTELFTHNKEVDSLNDLELMKLKTEQMEYKMTSSGIPFLVDTLKKHCLSPENLRLKIGATVMFTRNNFDEGYVNGTIGEVIGFNGCDDFDSNLPIIETNDGIRVIVKRADWTIEEKGITKAKISQFPLRLAWAVTVHKSQGMSLDAAKIDLSKTFEYGQGYVALSRVRSLDGLHVTGVNELTFEMHPKVIIQDNFFREESNNNEN